MQISFIFFHLFLSAFSLSLSLTLPKNEARHLPYRQIARFANPFFTCVIAKYFPILAIWQIYPYIHLDMSNSTNIGIICYAVCF